MTPQSIPANARPKISARARLQTDKVTGKPILLYPEGVLVLNPTGHVIVSLCNGEATLAEIVASLAERYKVSTEAISPQVTEYLNRLRARNLLELPGQAVRHSQPRHCAHRCLIDGTHRLPSLLHAQTAQPNLLM